MSTSSHLYHVRRTLVLAWPMILSRVGLVTMSMIDVIVLGRAGAQELANYILGQAVYDSLVGMIVGLLLGVPVLVARETGAENPGATGTILRRGLVLALILGAVLWLPMQFSGYLYAFAGQSEALVAQAGRVTAILAYGLPCIGLYYVCAAYLEALERPIPGFVAIATANVLNLVFNVILVHGWGPIPALGAVGCALATVFTFGLAALGMLIYLRRDILRRRETTSIVPPMREQTQIGLASGGAFLFEASSFAVLVLIIGQLGALALAAHGILFQFLALTFMIGFGIAGATQVRVGNAWGRNDWPGMARAGWTGLVLACLGTGAMTLLLGLNREIYVALFTDDAAVAAVALPVMIWAMLTPIFDGGQTVMNAACRGRGDTWFPTGLQFINYIVVLVPAAWLLAIPLGQGLAGVYQAIVLASILSVTLLGFRFHWLTRPQRSDTTSRGNHNAPGG
ncbi:MAG: MATE family efflux transporter [Pseudomonadota bacterium]